MKYRKLAGTSLDLSVISFGAWAAGGWMWGGNDRYAAIAAIHAALDLGVNAIDTAPIYGQGESEEIVGAALKGKSRAQCYLLTKFGMRWDLAKGNFAFTSKDNSGKAISIYKYAGRDSIIYECESSLRRLGTDYIDLYQIHWPDTSTAIDESMEAVSRLIAAGKIRYAGVCNYSAAQLAEAEKTIAVVSNQVPYSMVKRGIETELVPYCLAHNKSILAYSPLERGLLTGKIKPGHQFTDGDHRATIDSFKAANIRNTNLLLDKLRPLAAEKNISLGQLVLCWTIEQPGITVALVGARNAEQARQNALAATATLSPSELSFINSCIQNA